GGGERWGGGGGRGGGVVWRGGGRPVGGAAAGARGNRRRMRAGVARSPASGSCTPTMPRGVHAMAHRPIVVSKSVKPSAVIIIGLRPGMWHIPALADSELFDVVL